MPGSVLRVKVDTTPAAGLGHAGAGGRLLRQQPGVHASGRTPRTGLTPIAWFDSPAPLRSGWAWGQHYLDGGDRHRRGEGRQGPAGAVRAGDHVPRPAARDVQVPVQRLAQTLVSRTRLLVQLPAGRDDALAAAQQPSCGSSRVVTGKLPLGGMRHLQVPVRAHDAGRRVAVGAEQQVANLVRGDAPEEGDHSARRS